MRRIMQGAWIAACATLGAAAQVGAQEVAPKALVVTAENLSRRGDDVTAVQPGDVVRYQLRFTNHGDRAVQSVVFTNPIPTGLRYVPASAGADRDDVAIAYSIDGGATYSAQPTIEVVVDGKRVQRPAPPELYTHVRWTVRGWVAPGAQVTAEFRAHLPGEPQDSAPRRQ